MIFFIEFWTKCKKSRRGLLCKNAFPKIEKMNNFFLWYLMSLQKICEFPLRSWFKLFDINDIFLFC